METAVAPVLTTGCTGASIAHRCDTIVAPSGRCRRRSIDFVQMAPRLPFLSSALNLVHARWGGVAGKRSLAIASAPESPMAYCKVFLDGDGVRWAACPHLAGEGTDAVPLGFSFTSQHGERRALDGVLADCVSWEDFDDHEWRELLMASRAVRPRKPRSSRRFNRYEPEPTRRARK